MRKFIKNKLSIIIPTFNEADNINNLLNEIIRIVKNVEYEIIVVDDGSTDETVNNIFQIHSQNNKIKIIQREFDKGLLQSIKFALQTISGEFFLIMDGDGQHSPKNIMPLLKNLENNDLSIGVRDLKNTDGISKQRSFVSNVFNNIISFIFKKKLSDPLTGFFAGKTRILNKKFFSLNNSGFKILLDLIYCNKSVNFKITEKIIDFNKRETGSSKLNLQVSFSFLTQILSYLFNGLISSKFIGFIIIGSFGYLIHFLFLYIFMYYLSLSFLSSHLFTTLITASLNFFLNNFLNFHENEIKNLNTFFKSLLKYYLLNIPGIISSLGGASFVYNVLNKNPFLSSFIGAALDTVFKYILSKTWIWKSK